MFILEKKITCLLFINNKLFIRIKWFWFMCLDNLFWYIHLTGIKIRWHNSFARYTVSGEGTLCPPDQMPPEFLKNNIFHIKFICVILKIYNYNSHVPPNFKIWYHNFIVVNIFFLYFSHENWKVKWGLVVRFICSLEF